MSPTPNIIAFPGGQDLPFHELANLFPLIDDAATEKVEASVRVTASAAALLARAA